MSVASAFVGGMPMSGTSEVRRPLEPFPLIRTRNTDELEVSAGRYYGALGFRLPRGAKGFNVIANHCQLQSIGLTYAVHGVPLQIELPTFEYFGELFSFGGSAEAAAGRSRVEISRRQSFVANAGESIKLAYAADFQQFVLKIHSAALIKKLEALLGASLAGRLTFDPASDARRPESENLRRMVLFLVKQLESADSRFPALALSEYEQAMMVAFLCTHRHNNSHRFEREPSKPGPWQVHRAEEYIEQNWDQPLTVEALTIVTGVSARSLFHSFKHGRGYSPMEFVQSVRLRHANEMLLKPGPETSVTRVAFDCGFGNLGHFANYYRRRFGESPSQTLHRAKGIKLRRLS
jgi:AraC-like DNA-binding protein